MIRLLLPLLAAATAEVISDLVTTEADKAKALRLRSESFWGHVRSVAEEMRLSQHLQVYSEAQEVLSELPEGELRQALGEALERLQRADAAVLAQGLTSSKLAQEELEGPAGALGLSWLAEGSNFLSKALELFVDGDYGSRLGDQVRQRQQALLPVLRSAADVTSNVLQDTRLASKRAFDVLKYDIYTKGAPKTPENAKKVAHDVIEAVGETRRRFMQFVTGVATSLAGDVTSRKISAATTVASAELAAISEESATVVTDASDSAEATEDVVPQVEAGFSFASW
mmetsp:Transcript_99864/g.238022  ORF Transcript_99864/g.238022 Transcript_99864/m.238022 type:complete len:284 (+) Transcript_99864:98-949(+)